MEKSLEYSMTKIIDTFNPRSDVHHQSFNAFKDTFKFHISTKQKHSNTVHTSCCLTIWVQTFPGHLSGLLPPRPHTDPERAPRDWERYDGSPRHYPGTHTASQPQLFNDKWTGSYILLF